ncbi:MAG: primosomal protein N' [Clostridia bacterium]|nr:primosomal protein N' [Clostridia bacterium]
MTDRFLTAGVAVENTAFHFDKLYDYVIPEPMLPYARPGCRVMVSFGKGSLRQGMIMELHTTDDKTGLKMVAEVLDKEPVMSQELLELAAAMKQRCYCTLFDACSAMLPTGLSLKITYDYRAAEPDEEIEKTFSEWTETEQQIFRYLQTRKTAVRQDRLIKILGLTNEDILVRMAKKNRLIRTESVQKRLQDMTVKMVRLENDDPDRHYTPSQTDVLNVLRAAGQASRKELCYFTGVSTAVIDNLVKKGICSYFDEEPPRQSKTETFPAFVGDITLTPQQKKAFHSLIQKYESGKPSVSLLYGVTGSGKTSVFMKLIDRANLDNKGVICMVPEIALTPQLLAKFNARYGDRVAVFHSGLSLSKRLEEWKRVKNGEANIAVGTRSAIFAPLQNLGLIVMDEEQEYTYKSSSTPRFHARELAKLRCAYHHCLLLLSSATPSVESYYYAEQGRYSLETLSTRYGKAKLPHVITVDMNIDRSQGNTSDYSSVLLEAIDDNLAHSHQSIILLNRRGHNTFVSCRSCREVISCPNCSISLTFHSANHRLMCHYCGYSIPAPVECPNCHSFKLRYSGAGTQKAEQELYELFPSARILRLDTDSTMQRYAYEKKLRAFRDGEYDIMLGTQMVAKGLDFQNVTLVGVLSADMMMHGDDYRSYERTFSLLTQVVGRSGRGGLEGRAVIQTYEPENPIIEMAAAQDYNEFYRSEILLRRSMLYPPFADICVTAFMGEEKEKTKRAAHFFADRLSALASSEYSELPMRVLGPSAASILRLNGKYRFRIIIKFKNNQRFREMMARLLTEFGKERRFNGVTAYSDIDPDTVI